jgi:hypothetical protein
MQNPGATAQKKAFHSKASCYVSQCKNEKIKTNMTNKKTQRLDSSDLHGK